ncbi:hypothetical protein GCM10028808_28290 [Spirosoma migulaei]
MPNTITIREDRFDEQVFHLKISFNNGPEYEVQLPNPIDKAQEKEFEWYFEEHLCTPFLDGERAKRAVATIRQYGEALFATLFQAPATFYEYRTCMNSGLNQLEFAIIGKSTGFHAIHWEALRDPTLPQAFSAGQANVFRKNNRPAGFEAQLQPSSMLNLLMVTARPDWEDDVNYRTIVRPIIDLIESAKLRVDAHILRPGTYEQLGRHLDEKPAGFYHLIHFDTHGALLEHAQLQQAVAHNRYQMQARWGLPDPEPYKGKRAFLFFEGEKKGQAVPVSADELAQLLTARHIPVCLLNACQSAKEGQADEENGHYQTSLAAKLMEAGIQAVLGQRYSITVSAAKLLMQRLYETLFSQANLNGAIANGRRELAMYKNRRAYYNQTIELEDWLLPVFYQNRSVQFQLRALTADEEEQYYQQRAASYRPVSMPAYGFIGRDLDILTIEKRLLRHNMLLVRGMGGTGKTTLLEYLAQWWEHTGWVQKSFYFGYDKRSYTLQQMLHEIAHQLLDKWEYAQFQASSPVVQCGKIEDRLKTRAYCLILDNCESITGTSLAIPNTLTANEQAELRDFLGRLQKQAGRAVKSVVLFGSRSNEGWLAPATFITNTYSLPGLDKEARTDLGRQILEQANLMHVYQDPDFTKLMDLLAGYPLVMEVILPNLRQKTATQIIADLRAGDVNLDRKEGTDKTNSILRCVDYSHSNLSSDAQKLLLCLAPFSGYVNLASIEDYLDELKQQPSFQNYSFERWAEVIDEAVKWGLMEPIAEVRGILSLQPVFPYFLKQKLQTNLDTTAQHDLQTAFRNYYEVVSEGLGQLLEAKEPEKKKVGKEVVGVEYENIYNALQISLSRHLSVGNAFSCLSAYIDTLYDESLGLLLAQSVLSQLSTYPEDILSGLIGTELVFVFHNVGKRFLLTQNYPKAKDAYLKALSILQSSKVLSAKKIKELSTDVYHPLGMVAEGERKWGDAKMYYEKTMDILVEFNDRKSQGAIYHQLGYVAFEERNWVQAMKDYTNALEIYTEFNQRHEQGAIYHQMGTVALMERNWDKAKTYYQQSLAICNELGLEYEQAATYHQLGMVAEEEADLEQAKAYYGQSLEIKISFNKQLEQGITYQQLPSLTVEEGDLAQAKDYYQKALHIYTLFDSSYHQAGIYHQLGIVSKKEGNLAQAKDYYQEALKIYIELNERHNQAGTYHQLGAVAQEEQDLVQAEIYYQTALKIFIEAKDDRYQQMVLNSLQQLEEEQKD